MWMTDLGDRGHLMAMGHVFPIGTFGDPFTSHTPFAGSEAALPHAAAMMNLESRDQRWVFRFMPNFEGLTLPDGEVSFGAWGEGYIDSRHPHTYLHEAMISFNWWDGPRGSLSVSAGRGFAPFGTDDPMYRPALKYPTNHHLSQVLERWTLNTAWVSDGGWTVEAGIFDGNEPEHPSDVSNIDNFGNSFSARVARGFGGDDALRPHAPWEVSASFARIREIHDDHDQRTDLYNVSLRHDGMHDFGSLYGLFEASVSDPAHGDGYFSVLAEGQADLSGSAPFYRVEYATRPEYERRGDVGDDFFRYDHGQPAQGATRWLINTVGFSQSVTDLPLSVRPFVELSHHQVWNERGDVQVQDLFHDDRFWSITVGARVFLGGGTMRMGTYGVLDDMTAGMRSMDHMDHMDHPDDHDEQDHDHHDGHHQ